MAGSGGVRGRSSTRALRASIVLLALLALTACATPAHRGPRNSPAPPSTQPTDPAAVPVVLDPDEAKPATQRLFAPYDENGRLTVTAGPPTAGSCFATSIAVPVAGVFRCLAANTIFDPCFAPARESTPALVTCFADPWSDGQTLRVSGALPNYEPVLTTGDPWALELADGVRCVSVTGAVPALGKVDLNYRCDGATAAGITSGQNGTIIAHYGPVGGPLSDVVVLTAWRGRSFRLAGTR